MWMGCRSKQHQAGEHACRVVQVCSAYLGAQRRQHEGEVYNERQQQGEELCRVQLSKCLQRSLYLCDRVRCRVTKA